MKMSMIYTYATPKQHSIDSFTLLVYSIHSSFALFFVSNGSMDPVRSAEIVRITKYMYKK